jgi:pilus assembly protein Flp/PilA
MMRPFLRDEHGATSIEYGLIIALIFLVIVAAPMPIGQALSDMLQQAADGLG